VYWPSKWPFKWPFKQSTRAIGWSDAARLKALLEGLKDLHEDAKSFNAAIVTVDQLDQLDQLDQRDQLDGKRIKFLEKLVALSLTNDNDEVDSEEPKIADLLSDLLNLDDGELVEMISKSPRGLGFDASSRRIYSILWKRRLKLSSTTR
jgi:hypothetical protein